MKTFITILAMTTGNLMAVASDQFQDEVVCNKVQEPGEADNGLTLILRGNETAWVKLVTVYENGYLGPRQIANVQVPLQPEIEEKKENEFIRSVSLVYRGSGLELSLRVLPSPNYPLLGTGHASLALPGYEPIDVQLECKKVN